MKNRDSAAKVAFAASQYSKEKEYWLNKFAGELKKSTFPYDHFAGETGSVSSEGTGFVKLDFSAETSSELLKLSKNIEHRLFMILAAGLTVLLYKYTGGNNDIIFGSPIFKQEREGEYINTVLPLRIHLEDGLTFKELLLQNVRTTITEATEHQNYPIETLLFQLDMPITGNEFPLFDVVILLENIQYKKYIRHVHPKIIFNFSRTIEGQINAELEYDSHFYEKETIERIAGHFNRLVEKITVDIDSKVSMIDILSEQEKKQLLETFNGSRSEYPHQRSINELFEYQAGINPDGVALTYEKELLSYKHLNMEADNLASYLQARGLTRGEPTAVMIDNSPLAIISILGILKASGAYLPLNIDYPAERKKYILDDSQAKLLLTNCKETHAFYSTLPLLDVDNIPSFNSKNNAVYHVKLHGSDLAYIMYTSGSTGKPKGVLIEHRSVIRLVKNTNFFQFKKDDQLLLTGAMEFDASTFEIWGPLLNGLTLHLGNKNTILSPDNLKAVIRRKNINVMWMTSPLFNQLLDTDIDIFAGIKNLLVGGDVLSPSHISRLQKHYPAVNIINGYGPTENTTFSTTYLIKDEYREKIPIGKPIANSTAYILDAVFNLVPIGVPGELYVGGDGLARGYLNNPELTAEKFIKNRSDRSYKNYILYKTGDLARWLLDGIIEFLGRIDQQVKIRGYRIEPGEIEKRLKQFNFITEAVVIDRKNKNNEKYLCGYVVLSEKGKENFDPVELRKTLALNLPEYMVPAYFVQMAKFPLTQNGKINRKVLPEPEITSGAAAYAAPRNHVEEKFIDIWSDVLKIEKEKISIDSDFFELGGHSLKATILISKLNKAFDVKVPLSELFRIPTIRELGEYIQGLKKEEYSSIKAAEKKEYYELSAAQKRHYFLQQLEPNSTVYNVSFKTILKGKAIAREIQEIFKKLIKRHSSLRTSFQIINGTPVQRIHEKVEFEIEKLKNREIENFQLFIRPFDLSAVPLLRVGLCENGAEEFILAIDMHHIITDGTSMDLLINEFIQLHQDKELPFLRLQYSDYSEWQNSPRVKKNLEQQKKYWLKEFEKEIPVLELSTDYPRPVMQSFAGDSIAFNIFAEAGSLKSLASLENYTIFMIFLAIYNVLLYRLSGQEDIIIGTPIACRRHADLEKIVGMFVNTLALRNFPAGEKSFTSFLKEVKNRSVEAFENQDYQFEELVESVVVNRDVGRNPVFDVMFVVQNFTSAPGTAGDTIQVIEEPGNIPQIAKFDLTLNILENDKGFPCLFQYCSSLFKKETITRFISYFKKIVSTILQNPGIKLHEIEILAEDEKKQILYEFNHIEPGYPVHKNICQLFTGQANQTPDAVALYVTSYITYSELDNRSDRLAQRLIQNGVQPGSIVGLMAERSAEMITAIVATWKTGCAYAPLNPKAPFSRNKFMLSECGVKTLLITQSLRETTAGWQGTILAINEKFLNPQGTLPLSLPSRPLHSANLAYVIFTSGSTGNPKGVISTHANLSPLLHWGYRHLGIGVHDRTLQNLSYYFDWSVWEIFITLTTGASLYIVPEDLLLDAAAGVEFIYRHNVTILHMTPTQYRYFVKAPLIPVTLKYLFIGAEKLSYDLVKQSFTSVSSGCRVFNMYGPTEATIISAVLEIQRESFAQFGSLGSIPIGKTAGNSIHLILDKYGNLCPVNIAGELYIGGDGVSMGYLNNPELTAEKFDQDNINKNFFRGSRGAIFSKKAPLVFYKTGDLARWLIDGPPAGIIEYLGRIDEQVKIRGFRIECGEIESRLIQYPGIKEAVVLVKEEEGSEKFLIAYIVCNNEAKEIPTHELKQYLARWLPDYMLPAYFVPVEKIPLNPNGKIDRKALPDVQPVRKDEYRGPSNEIEKQLVDIWSAVLGIEKNKLNIDDSFFELGGHSLKATVLLAKVHQVFNIKFPLAEFFLAPTIKESAEYIGKSAAESFSALPCVEKKEYYLLSSAQKRIYILQQMELESIAYNMAQIFQVSGQLNFEKLEIACKQLIQRHESLRTSFHMQGKEPVQRIHDQVEFKIEQPEIDGQDFIRPFDLTMAPLLRLRLIKKTGEEYLFMVDMHHIISDGVSQDILIADFIALYNETPLEPVKIQYKDYSEWQNNSIEKEKIKKQEVYWLNVFCDEVPVLNILPDYPRPAVQSFAGRLFHFKLPSETFAALKSIAVSGGATLYMVLLAIYNVLLTGLTGQEDIIVGTVTAGRRHADLEKTIGMFVNTLALRNYPGGHKKFREFLAEIKENTLTAFENQEYQFEDLVEKLMLKRDISRNPIFDTMFTLNQANPEKDTDRTGNSQLKIKPYIFESEIAKFDLILQCIENDGQLVCSWNYCIKLFKEDTIRCFTGYFTQVIAAVVNNKNTKLSQVELITPDEKKQILYEFNYIEPGYPVHKNICQLFAGQAIQTPDAVALYVTSYITYSELDNRSDRLAQRLIQNGVQPGSIVGLMAERSAEMITAIVATWKTGCAYAPLNPKAPFSRNKFMLTECGVKTLLITQSLCETTAGWQGTILAINEKFLNPQGTLPLSLPSRPLHSANLAYVIFTSGSTGNPKGVIITHANLSPLLHWGYRHLGIGVQERTLQNLSYYFDWSVWEIFITLTTGASLYIVPEDLLLDAAAGVEFINRHNVTILHIAPTQYRYFVKAPLIPVTLKYLFIGAEKLSYDLVKQSFTSVSSGCRVFNMYGPTEATIISAVLEIQRESFAQFGSLSLGSIPIGKAAGNSIHLILDRYDNLCPVNIAGELYIGGDGVSMGYLNNPELTAEKFDQDLWDVYDDQDKSCALRADFQHSAFSILHSNLYYTGDLARWLPDGNIEFLGRIDNQVKIRGFRVELGEIEARLANYPGIKDAVVLAPAEDGDKYLCAYIVAGKEYNAGGLRQFLLEKLPNYMVPSYFVLIEKIPLTPNGKLDWRALPKPAVNVDANYTGPRNEIQRQLVEIWSGILDIEINRLSIDGNFFELGGHSLKATELASAINKNFNIMMPLADIFRAPTIRDLGIYINKTKRHIQQTGDTNLVLLKKSTAGNKFLFLVHDGSGEVEGYIEFCGQLELDIDCWGIRAEKLKGDAPSHLRIETMAENYIKKIKTLQPQGPYYIAGWSLGGTLAFEMAYQLETNGEMVSFLGLIDSPGPRKATGSTEIEKFTIDSEKTWLKNYLPVDVLIKKFESITDIDKLWLEVVAYLAENHYAVEKVKQLIPVSLAQIISGYERLGLRELINYLNLVRSLNFAREGYVPRGKIRTEMHYLKAIESGEITSGTWPEYCFKPLHIYEINAGHYTIFQQPAVNRVVEIFRNLLLP